ncbi:MAG TPA: NIL domain-containing protein, partial [Burkholderiaceae bacterium]
GAALPPARSLLLELRLTGENAREFELGALALAVGGPVQLLHGGIDRIQGRALGRVIVAARTSLRTADALQHAVGSLVDRATLLGVRDGRTAQAEAEAEAESNHGA